MSDTGRQYFIDLKTGRKFVIETIDNSQGKGRDWGDIDPATKKVTGSYGNKHIGSITDEESIITKENGFDKIYTTDIGESPYSLIEKILKKE